MLPDLCLLQQPQIQLLLIDSVDNEGGWEPTVLQEFGNMEMGRICWTNAQVSCYVCVCCVCVWQIPTHMEIGKHPTKHVQLREGYVPGFKGEWKKEDRIGDAM